MVRIRGWRCNKAAATTFNQGETRMASPAADEPMDRVLARAAKGEQAAWRVVVDAYSKRVFGLLVRQCGDRELAEEITQATFVQVVVHLQRYREEGRFEPWLFRIAMNKLRDEMRRRGRQARPMDMTAGRGGDDEGAWQAVQSVVVHAAGPEGAESEDPMERVSRAEQVQRLREAIAGMNEADQRILHLRHTAGLSFARIAAALGEPLGTVLARGHRAMLKLRKLMSDDEDEPAAVKKRANT